MMIERTLKPRIEKLIGTSKAILIMGPRQVGKSTLLREIFSNTPNVLWLSGDDPDVQRLFADMTSTRLQAYLSGKDFLVLDEAQRIDEIGLRLKLITDHIPQTQVIATGSSSFDLARGVNESLTGRKREFQLLPVSFEEMVNHTSLIEEERMIPHRMVYGYYPEVVTSPGDEKTVLRELTDSYLYKDILALDKIAKSDKLTRLAQALAYQIGSQVSYSELAKTVGIDAKTVERYIELLEKSYIIFRLGSFSRNLRNELTKSKKIFFWDLGIRNAIIANFKEVENRNDAGQLWENFVIAERLKHNKNQGNFVNTWFWRTQQQAELDLIEESDGVMRAIEIKWNPAKANAKIPSSFATAYPDAKYQVVTPETFHNILLS